MTLASVRFPGITFYRVPYRWPCCFARLTLALKRASWSTLKALCATPAGCHSQLEITLHNPLTNQSRTVTTDEQGFLRAEQLLSAPMKCVWNRQALHLIGKQA